MIVSAAQHCESSISIHIVLTSLVSLLPPTPDSSRSSQSAEPSSPVLYSSFPLVAYFTHGSVCICRCYSLNSSYPLLHCIQFDMLMSIICAICFEPKEFAFFCHQLLTIHALCEHFMVIFLPTSLPLCHFICLLVHYFFFSCSLLWKQPPLSNATSLLFHFHFL